MLLWWTGNGSTLYLYPCTTVVWDDTAWLNGHLKCYCERWQILAKVYIRVAITSDPWWLLLLSARYWQYSVVRIEACHKNASTCDYPAICTTKLGTSRALGGRSGSNNSSSSTSIGGDDVITTCHSHVEPPGFSFRIPSTSTCNVKPLSIPTANKGFNRGSATPASHVLCSSQPYVCNMYILQKLQNNFDN